MGIETPDITVCNHLGFDRTVLKKIDEVAFQSYLKSGGREPVEFSGNNSYPGLFGKALSRSMIKYELFHSKYLNYEELNLSSTEREEMDNLKYLFGKQMMIGHMSQEEILDGGIPEWQLLMWCKYGRPLTLQISQFPDWQHYVVQQSLIFANWKYTLQKKS